MESYKNPKKTLENVIDEYVPRDRPSFLDEPRMERFDIDFGMMEVIADLRIGKLQTKLQLYYTSPTPQLKEEIINTEYIAKRGLWWLFSFAAKHGDIHDFDILVRNYGQAEVMKAACKHDRRDVFDHFIRLGVIPTSNDLNASKGRVRQTLLKMGLTDVSSFWNACMKGKEDEFHQLILNGADINATPWFSKKTPLYVALERCIANNISPQDDAIVTKLCSLGAFS